MSLGGAVSKIPGQIGAAVQAQKSDQQLAYEYLLSHGLTPIGAAAVVGNMQAESSMNPEEINSLGCCGLVQWCFGRQDCHKMVTGNRKDDFYRQLDTVLSELHSSQYNQLMTILASAPDPATAARVFENIYERSGGALIAQREAYATAVYKAAGNNGWSALSWVGHALGGAAGAVGGAAGAVGGVVGDAAGAVVDTAKATANFLETISKFFTRLWSTLTSVKFWYRFGEILLGTILLLVGIWLFAQESITVRNAEKDVAAGTAVAAAA